MKIFLLFLLIISAVQAQSKLNYDFSITLTSRFIGRGVDCSQKGFGPHIQPSFNIYYPTSEYEKFSIYTWSTWGMENEYNELNISVVYSHLFEFGQISLSVTDYYFPYLKKSFLKIQNNNGEDPHTFDAAISYSGPEEFPVSFTASNNFYNCIKGEKSFYSEVGYPFQINDKFSIDAFIGGALGESSWYEVESNKFEIIHTGFSLNYELQLWENFSLPLSFWFISNPNQEKNYAGISFTFTYN